MTTRWLTRPHILLVVLGLLAVVAVTAYAQGPGYDLSWWTADGGGTSSANAGGYFLGATAGQADAGTLAGGEYTLSGGFWGGVTVNFQAYLPVQVRQ